MTVTKRIKPGEICYFTVAGAGNFPIDMLRYDACWPASSEDASKIAAGSFVKPMGQRTVVLACKPGDNAWHIPTHARWSSFNWTAGNLRETERDYR